MAIIMNIIIIPIFFVSNNKPIFKNVHLQVDVTINF